jgi:hypothetical protein
MVTSKALSIFDNLNQLTPYAVGFDRVFDQLNTTLAIMQHQQGSHHITSVKGVTTPMPSKWPWRDLVRMILKSK